ncbi:MAG: peptide chain release factor N(5)-glutamine methyltransferase [Sphingobium sp.]|jgi:release factor glutamine methyltransferase|nr:peptide chain release factor N(5)-glutamine methyltransferase [Sphingobium sp.]
MVKSASEALRDAAARLSVVSDTPRLDAELLMAHALELSREDMLLRLRDMDEPEGFATLVERRMAHEPVSHIIGTRDFWTLSLRVTSDVLTPRPDSETLIEAGLAHFEERAAPRRILDLGTGSGALLLAALSEWSDATGLGVDISEAALEVARGNAQRYGMAARAEFRRGDWFEGVDGVFDLILANPPYIKKSAPLPRDVAEYEPHLALFAGEDGLDAYRLIALSLAQYLAPGGMAAIEIGFDQGTSAARLFADHGLKVTVKQDLAGQDRCLSVTR